MSLRPIDLQNMYVRMAEVSKQQSAIQQANALAQETAAREIAKKSSDEESRVAETRDLEDGTEKDQGVGLHEDGKAKNPYNRGDPAPKVITKPAKNRHPESQTFSRTRTWETA